jgi:deoxyribonuclease-4
MNLGVHCSAAGGVINAFKEVQELGLDTFQIFTKNQRQWKEKSIDEQEGKDFKAALKKSKINKSLSHCTYLINLASCDEEIRKKSILALGGELLRCEALGINYAVLHPGACKGLSEAEGIKLVADALNLVINSTPDLKVKILLENTAGQGSALGYKFEQLKSIIDMVEFSERVGVCIDTCHAFAAGFDIRSKSGFEDTISKLENTVGLKKLFAFHINDSKGDLGSRIDRHDSIGDGKIGLTPFKEIMKSFSSIPKILELTPELDRKSLEVIRNF